MTGLPPFPSGLPWTLPAYLLLDGVSVPQLARHLSPWENPAYVLYQRTRWQDLSDISPRLIALTGADDPLLAHFQEHAQQEWGYLLFSDAEILTLWDHWRHLLAVEYPGGEEVMPRIADPAVMHPLFGLAEHANSARWFGPVAHVCLPDGVKACWHQHRRPDYASAEPDLYCLTEAEISALGEVESRNAVSELLKHVQRWFPALTSTLVDAERRHYVQTLADDAYAKGFTSEQEISLYVNVLGYLASQSLTFHPHILELLTPSAKGEALRRLQTAAELARYHSTQGEGSHP